MVVNLNDALAMSEISELESRLDVPMYQDTDELHIWEVLNGVKDDFLIYDRCGQLTYHIRMPGSFLGYSNVRNAILNTYVGSDTCTCSPDDVDDELMATQGTDV